MNNLFSSSYSLRHSKDERRVETEILVVNWIGEEDSGRSAEDSLSISILLVLPVPFFLFLFLDLFCVGRFTVSLLACLHFPPQSSNAWAGTVRQTFKYIVEYALKICCFLFLKK